MRELMVSALVQLQTANCKHGVLDAHCNHAVCCLSVAGGDGMRCTGEGCQPCRSPRSGRAGSAAHSTCPASRSLRDIRTSAMLISASLPSAASGTLA
jgi:hypothetical protein